MQKHWLCSSMSSVPITLVFKNIPNNLINYQDILKYLVIKYEDIWLLFHCILHIFRNCCKSYVTHVFIGEAKVMGTYLFYWFSKKEKRNLRAGTKAQWLRACAALQEDQVPFPASMADSLQQSVIPGHLTPSSGLLGHCIHVHIQAEKNRHTHNWRQKYVLIEKTMYNTILTWIHRVF